MTQTAIPADRFHTNAHEWLQALPDGNYAVGISHAGQDMLGDIVFCGEAQLGKLLQAGDICALVESVKAASDVHMPIHGEVIAFNSELTSDPSILNADAYGTWIVKIKPTGIVNLNKLMPPEIYKQQI